MKLATLKEKLQTIDETDIGEVYFDLKEINAVSYETKYPVIFWDLGIATFTGDIDEATIQKVELLNTAVWAFARYDYNVMDRIAEWDILKSKFYVYLNLIHKISGLNIKNIRTIKIQLIPEGVIQNNSQIGILIESIQLELTCNV